MASRDKKSALTKKQSSASPVPAKDVIDPTGNDPQAIATGSDGTQDPVNQPLAITKSQRIRNPSAIVRSLRKPDLRKNVAVKTPLKLRVNSKAKLTPATGSKVRKAVLRSRSKGIDANKLAKNGLTKVIRKKDAPLLLDNGEAKKETGKRKRPTRTIDVPVDTINQCIDSIIAKSNKPVKKTTVKARKVVKTEVIEPIEDISIDSNPLLAADDIKKESMSDTDSNKPAKKTTVVRKQKAEPLKKKITKENLENKMETSNTNIIDMLDLNVPMTKKVDPKKRRHSIEKFSISISDTPGNSTLFVNVPRSSSPRTRRLSKIRQSMDIRRSSPYTTRSDSPARTLRNGKHRKLKHLNLLEGLDHDFRKRKRLCSDFSGSEVSISKLSGYESDSSYSDLASLHGAEVTVDSSADLKTEAAVIKKELLETYVNNPPDTPISVSTTISTSPSIAAAAPAVVVKRSISMDQPQQPEDVVVPTDNNSNLCTPDATQSSRADKPVQSEENIPSSPSFKVPEKSIILENMKANFNDAPVDELQSKQLQQLELAHQLQIQQKQLQILPSPALQLPAQQTSTPLPPLERGKRTTRSATKKPIAQPNEIASTSAVEDKVVSPAIFYNITDSKPVETVEVNLTQSDTKVDVLKAIDSDINITPTVLKAQIEKVEQVPENKSNNLELNQKVIQEIKPITAIQKSKSPELKVRALEPRSIVTKASDSKVVVPKVLDSKATVPMTLFTGRTMQPALVIPISTPNPPPLPEPMDIEDSITAHKVGFNDKDKKERIVETPENMAIKENILSALGLQSLRAAEEAAKMRKVPVSVQASSNGAGSSGTSNITNVGGTSSYSSGTLKTVIKLNRDRTKKPRSSLKMTLQKSNKPKGVKTDQENAPQSPDADEYKVMKEKSSTSTSWKHQTGHSSDTAGAQRKTHYSNRSNLDGSSEHTSDGDTNMAEEGNTGKILVIPEKASSFSIHPGRVCKDECTYCFGKFGLFDTPCHIGSMKSAERQEKILNTEKHLTRDSCLCDACFRHVDRKSNAPSYLNNKNYKRNTLVGPGPRQNHCHVLGCANESTNILKRKWIIKMRKAVCEVINIDLDNPGLHSIPVCEEHYSALEHLMICAMCKRRLARNHIHYLGPESSDLNAALNEMGIPVKLCKDRPVVCKLCKYFATLILKSIEDKNETTLTFEREYRKRLLHFHDVQIMNEDDAEGPIPVPTREKVDPVQHQGQQQQQDEQQLQQPKKRRKIQKSLSHGNNTTTAHNLGEHHIDKQSNENTQRADSPSDYMVDYQNLIPAINIETGSDHESNTSTKKDGATIIANKKLPIFTRKTIPLNFKTSSMNNNTSTSAMRSDVAVKRLNSNTSISVRQLFPGEEDLPLNAHIDFNTIKERTPEGWEKSNCTIQYDVDTKSLWSELQKPYGNQSSFLRHLILLEKYFRNGDLVLTPNASHHSSNYTESVQNRLRAYDNIPSLSIGASSSAASGNTTNTGPIDVSSVSTQQLQPLSSLLQQYSKTTMPPNRPIRKSSPPSLTSMSQLREPPLLVNAANIPKSTPISLAHLTNLVSNSGAVSLNLGPSVATSVSAVLNSNTSSSASSNTNAAAVSANGIAVTTTGLSTNVGSPAKPSKVPPGLISLQPGTNKPVTPLSKSSPPPSQKIKFPITKNWRPNLIPIDPTKKIEKRTGLVQVISGGKPYHITLEDYKKMCAIKRTFDLRQKRLQEQKSMMMNMSGGSPVPSGPSGASAATMSTSPTNNLPPQMKALNNHNNNNSAAAIKSLAPRKSLTISKTAVSRTEETSSSTAASALPLSAPSLNCSTENSLEKLDKHVENLEVQFNSEKSPIVPPLLPPLMSTPSPMMHMPKIPKSLTVIPQTVVRKLDTNSPGLPISSVHMASNSGGSVVVTSSAPSNTTSLTQSAAANQKASHPTPTTASLIAARPLGKS